MVQWTLMYVINWIFTYRLVIFWSSLSLCNLYIARTWCSFWVSCGGQLTIALETRESLLEAATPASAVQCSGYNWGLGTSLDICFFYLLLMPSFDFSPKKLIKIWADTKSIVMKYFIYTLKFANSPYGEISTSPAQRFVLKTCSHTFPNNMLKWR